MRLLLVDDELPAREYLGRLVHWEEEGYEFLEAENGKEAIEIMQRMHVDLLLLDITMPVMNGLEVLEWIHEQQYDCVATLLTCHDEFEYAKKAIQYGCFDHVLKSDISAKNILGLVERMREAASEEEKQRQYYRKLEVEAQRKRMLEGQHILAYWLRDNEVPLVGIDNYLRDLLGISDGQNRYAVLTLHIQHYPEVVRRYTNNNVVQFSTVIDGVLHELLEGFTYFGTQPSDGLYFILLWFERQAPTPLLMEKLQVLTQHIDSSFRNTLSIDLAVIYSLPFKAIAEGRALFLKMRQLLAQKFFGGLEGVSCIEDYLLEEELYGARLQELETQLGEAISSRNLGQIELCYDSFVEKVQKERICIPQEAFMQCCEHCLLKFFSECEQHGPAYQPPEFTPTAAVFKQFLLERIQPFCISEDSHDKTTIIKRALLLIQQNYAEDIGLEWLASRLFVSTSYLSRLFSEEMGQPLTSYLNTYRVEQAKKLIRTSNLKLYEIAQRVGFSSPIVFSTIFKRFTGVTPTAYKNEHL